MSGARKVTLGGKEFEIRPLTLKGVQVVTPLLTQQRLDTPAGMAAMQTVVFEGLKTALPKLTFDEFQALEGVSVVELQRASKTVGQMIGYFAEDDAKETPPGEGGAEESA